MRIVRTDEQVAELQNRAVGNYGDGRSEYPGMSFEAGIDLTIEWLTCPEAEYPFDDE